MNSEYASIVDIFNNVPQEFADKDIPFKCFETFDKNYKEGKSALEEINDTVKVVLIASGTYGQSLVPKLAFNKNIHSFNLICKPSEVLKVQKLQMQYPKVHYVNDDFTEFYLNT